MVSISTITTIINELDSLKNQTTQSSFILKALLILRAPSFTYSLFELNTINLNVDESEVIPRHRS